MNVLLLTHRYPPEGAGGVGQYVESVARALAAAGDRVTVLTRRPAHFPRRPRLAVDATDGVSVLRVEGSGVRVDEPLARHERLENGAVATSVVRTTDHVERLRQVYEDVVEHPRANDGDRERELFEELEKTGFTARWRGRVTSGRERAS